MGFCLEQQITALYEIEEDRLSEDELKKIEHMTDLINDLDTYVDKLFNDLVMKKELLMKESKED